MIVRDITCDVIENATLLLRELLQKNDPLINAMLDWFKGWYDPIEDKKLERIGIEDIKRDLLKSVIKRKQFYQAFRDNCQDSALQKEFSKALEEFMERKT